MAFWLVLESVRIMDRSARWAELVLGGFGLRVTAKDTWGLQPVYRIDGRERHYTIGAYPNWSVSPAPSGPTE